MEELFEKKQKRKAERRIELFFGEVHGVILRLLCRYDTTLHQLDGDVVWKAKMVPEFSLIQNLSGFTRVGANQIRIFPTT